MTQIEQEIVDRLSKLDSPLQQQVLDFVRQLQNSEGNESRLTLGEWLKKTHILRSEFRAKYGDSKLIDTQSMLDEVREERLNDLMGSR